MRRFLCILLFLSIALPLCACTEQEAQWVSPAEFYYLRVQEADKLHHGDASSVIAAETVEGAVFKGDLAALLEQYLKGPTEESLRSPFPSQTKPISCARDGSKIIITLDDHFATLTGIDLTLACACLSITCLSASDAESVRIQAETVRLDGKQYIEMDRSTILLVDNSGLAAETE